MDFEVLREVDFNFFATLAEQAANTIENLGLGEKLLTDKNYRIINALAIALDAKDTYTRIHSERVAKYALQIAQELRLDKKEMERIGEASLLHDIGKINVCGEILNKEGKITPEEYREIKRHPVSGVLKLLSR